MADHKFKILLVDDDEMIRIYFHDIFWIHGFENKCELINAATLDEAEAIVEDPDRRPDIIFLDLGLPKKVGDRTFIDPEYSFDFLKKIKGDPKLSKIVVMIFSGHAEKELEKQAKECGADGYIHKEESLPNDLVAIVNKLFDAKKH